MNQNYVNKQYNYFHKTYSSLTALDEFSTNLYYSTIPQNLGGFQILDIGCGDGTDLRELTKRGAKVYGIDPSEKFLSKAKIQNPTGTFINARGEALPFPEKYFDLVVSKWALQTSTDVPKILTEAARVLKPGGYLIFLTKHPIMQWLEKIRDFGHGISYYEQKIVTSNIYNGSIQLKEPTHTLGEYLCKDFFNNFELQNYQEATDFPASEQLNEDIYPTFFIIKSRRK